MGELPYTITIDYILPVSEVNLAVFIYRTLLEGFLTPQNKLQLFRNVIISTYM